MLGIYSVLINIVEIEKGASCMHTTERKKKKISKDSKEKLDASVVCQDKGIIMCKKRFMSGLRRLSLGMTRSDSILDYRSATDNV
jgi:hypothetical protein